MARFYVGQRVRLVRNVGAKNFGITGTIAHFHAFQKGTAFHNGISPFDTDCGVLYDDDGTRPCVDHTSRLEPLTDSNELVSWESMRDLWVPEHLRIKA